MLWKSTRSAFGNLVWKGRELNGNNFRTVEGSRYKNKVKGYVRQVGKPSDNAHDGYDLRQSLEEFRLLVSLIEARDGNKWMRSILQIFL